MRNFDSKLRRTSFDFDRHESVENLKLSIKDEINKLITAPNVTANDISEFTKKVNDRVRPLQSSSPPPPKIGKKSE